MTSAAGTADYTLSLAEFSDQKLRSRIVGIALSGAASGGPEGANPPLIQIDGAHGQANALMAIQSPVRLHVTGPLGDYALSYCNRCDVRVDGGGGHGVAECLYGGSIRFRGDVGHGAGVGMSAGTLAVYGSAGDRLGAAMRGGEVFARGDVGCDAGVGMQDGTIVIGGDAGHGLGEPRGWGVIFLRGQAESLADGMVEVPLRKRDELRLGMLLINASIRGMAKEFRRVIPESIWRQEQSQITGETRPNWR
jgi:methylamine---glutamate N-methyltransferase subunit B